MHLVEMNAPAAAATALPEPLKASDLKVGGIYQRYTNFLGEGPQVQLVRFRGFKNIFGHNDPAKAYFEYVNPLVYHSKAGLMDIPGFGTHSKHLPSLYPLTANLGVNVGIHPTIRRALKKSAYNRRSPLVSFYTKRRKPWLFPPANENAVNNNHAENEAAPTFKGKGGKKRKTRRNRK